MSDPFATNSNPHMVRDAQLGLSLIAVLLCVFVYVAYYRITGQGRQLPAHVRNAPVAQAVWPDYRPDTDRVTALEANANRSKNADVAKRLSRTSGEIKPVSRPKPVAQNTSPQRKRVRRVPPKVRPPRPTVVPATFEQPTKTVKPAPAVKPAVAVEASKPQPEVKPVRPSNDFWPLEATKPPALKAEAVGSVAKKTIHQPAAKTSFSTPPTKPPKIASPRLTPPKPLRIAPPQPSASLRPAAKPQIDIARSTTITTPPKPPQPEATSVQPPLPAKNRPPAAPPAAKMETETEPFYFAKQGDSFWSIASERYGDGRLFRALYEHNRLRVSDFDSLTAGTKLAVPAQQTLVANYAQLCPRDATANHDATTDEENVVNYDQQLSDRLYITHEGDTLFMIAAQTLGQASRYLEILSINDVALAAEVDQSSPLPAGLKLLLPE